MIINSFAYLPLNRLLSLSIKGMRNLIQTNQNLLYYYFTMIDVWPDQKEAQMAH